MMFEDNLSRAFLWICLALDGPRFFWIWINWTNQRIRRNSSQVVSYSEERKEWVFNAGKGSGRPGRLRETLIFQDFARVQRQSKTSQGENENICWFVDPGRPKRWFRGRQEIFEHLPTKMHRKETKLFIFDATSWSTEKLILNFKDDLTYGFAKTNLWGHCPCDRQDVARFCGGT